MLLVYALLLGAILGLAWKVGPFHPSLRVLRGGGIFCALLLMESLFPPLAKKSGIPADGVVVIRLGLTVCLAAMALRNLWYPGMLLMCCGAIANAMAIAANGSMPVSLSAVSRLGGSSVLARARLSADMFHEVLTKSTLLKPLCDLVPVSGPVWGRGVFSIGDFGLGVGAALLVAALFNTSSPSEPED